MRVRNYLGRGHNFRGGYLCGLYIQEPHQVLKVKIRERSLCGSIHGKKSIIIVKYTKNILHNTLQGKIQRILLYHQIWFLAKAHTSIFSLCPHIAEGGEETL